MPMVKNKVFSNDAKDFLNLVTKGAPEKNGFGNKEETEYLLFVALLYITLFSYICFGIGQDPKSNWAHPPEHVPDTHLYESVIHLMDLSNSIA